MNKHLLGLGIAVLLISVGLSGCIGSEERELFDKISGNLYNEYAYHWSKLGGNFKVESYDDALIYKKEGNDFYEIAIEYGIWDSFTDDFEYGLSDTYYAKAKRIGNDWEIREHEGGNLQKFWESWDIIDEEPVTLPVTFTGNEDEVTAPFLLTEGKVEFRMYFETGFFSASIYNSNDELEEPLGSDKIHPWEKMGKNITKTINIYDFEEGEYYINVFADDYWRINVSYI